MVASTSAHHARVSASIVGGSCSEAVGPRVGPDRRRLTGGMSPIARFGAVSLDAADPPVLADFYRRLLDLVVLFEADGFIALKGPAVMLTVQKVDDHQPPAWPSGGVPKQLHLELA